MKPTETEAFPIPARYLDEAERPETEARLQERLPAKLRRIADSRLVNLAKEAYGYATHPSVSRGHKLMGAAALLYLIAPLDAISDWIPGVGYVDDAAVLTAFVVSVREAAKQVVSHAQQAAQDVASHAISQAREAWAQRGVSQVSLSLWAATLAASVGLIYTGVRTAVSSGSRAAIPADPFLWACMLAGVIGLVYQVSFAYRVWARYAAAPAAIKEPLAYAIVSLASWRQAIALALPLLLLFALLAARRAWGI